VRAAGAVRLRRLEKGGAPSFLGMDWFGRRWVNLLGVELKSIILYEKESFRL
jgi:hypothetical protein